METSGSVSSTSDVRAIIYFLCSEGEGGNEIYLHLCNIFGERDIMSKYIVHQCVEKFKVGRRNKEDGVQVDQVTH